MKSLAAIALAPVLAGCATPYAVQERVTLIDPSFGERATTTCSRAGPENPTRFFTPEAHEVTAIESAAMRLLRDRREEYAALVEPALANNADPFAWPDDPSLYSRQYIGYYEDGRRMIYGSYFPASSGPVPSEPKVLCDGGFSFFEVEYDLDARAIRRIAFDGSRGGPVLPPIEP